MEAWCIGCGRKTKQICIECLQSICNICSVSVTPETKGYDKEEKKVTLFQKCNTEKEVKITKEHKANTKKRIVRQNIFSALKVKSTSKRNPQQHKVTSQQTRTVTPATVEKWKSEMAVHPLSEWLTYSIDNNGKVQDKKWTVRVKYEEQIKDMSNFPTSLSKAQRITESWSLKNMQLKVGLILKL